jgi:hypothetical protein
VAKNGGGMKRNQKSYKDFVETWVLFATSKQTEI